MAVQRKLQLTDFQDPTNLRMYRYLTELEETVASLRAAVQDLTNRINSLGASNLSIETIRRDLMASGKYQLSVEALYGKLKDRQNPDLPVLTALPDPNTTGYSAVIITGAPNRIHYLRTDRNPRVWLQIG